MTSQSRRPSDCVAWERQRLWRARYLGHSPVEPEFMQLRVKPAISWSAGRPLQADQPKSRSKDYEDKAKGKFADHHVC
jgi:hypothetical protein